LNHLLLKLLCSLFCVCSAAEPSAAQVNNNTVFQRAFNGAVTTGASVPMRNIGQQYHLIVASITQSVGAPCDLNSYTGLLRLEASTDSINWVVIGDPIISIPSTSSAPFAAVTSASGAYAYVRVNYVLAFSSNCPLTVYYSGSITGTLTGSAPFTSAQDTFQYATRNSAASGTVVIGTCPTQTLPQIYSIVISTPGGAQTVTLAAQTAADPPVVVWNFGVTTIAGSTPTVLPQGTRPYITLPAVLESPSTSYNLALTTSAATEADVFISYRCE